MTLMRADEATHRNKRDFASDRLKYGQLVCQYPDALTERERDVTLRYYGLGYPKHTYQAVADHLGVSRERVRQLRLTAESKLQNAVGRCLFLERDRAKLRAFNYGGNRTILRQVLSSALDM